MGFRLPRISHVKQMLRRSSSRGSSASSAMTPDVPKGYIAVYTGENQMKRFVIPISYLNQPEFHCLLSQSEEEFGFDHPIGGLTIPCREDFFADLISRLNGSAS